MRSIKSPYFKSLFLWDLGDREYPKELDELDEKVEKYQEDSFIYQLLFVKAIFILEDFLSNEAKRQMNRDHSENRYKIESLPKKLKEANLIKFKSNELITDDENFNMTLGDIFLQKANEHIEGISFHNQEAANHIYKTLFEIDLNKIYNATAKDKKESKFFEDAIEKRHGIVHRNGKDTVRDEIKISLNDIEDLIENIKKFIGKVTSEINEKSKNMT